MCALETGVQTCALPSWSARPSWFEEKASGRSHPYTITNPTVEGPRFTARPLQSADDERMVRPTRRLDRRASARGRTGDLRDRVLRRGDRGRRDRAGAAAAVRDRRADRAWRTVRPLCGGVRGAGRVHRRWPELLDRPPMGFAAARGVARSEEHTSELQSLMRISYAVFCLKKKKH